jgi:hypothetical protein
MPSYIQIGDDPTKWWLPETISASQLTGQPLTVPIIAPLFGTMVISPKSASVAIFDTSSPPPSVLTVTPAPTIYLPTATGASEEHAGYELPAGAPPNLAGQIAASMSDGHSQTVTLAGGGTLVLNGATLSFVVIKPGVVFKPGMGDESEPSG